MKVLRAVFNFGKELWKQTVAAQLLLVASSLAYTTILSIIPVLAVSFAVFRAFGGMEKLYGTIEPFILSNLAEGSGEEVMAALHRFIDNAHAGAIGASGFAALIVTSMSMLSSAEKAINRVWHQSMTRTFFQRVASYWLFITLGPLALAVAIGVATSDNLPLSGILPHGVGLFFMTAAVFTIVYKWVPHCKVHFSVAAISGFVTATIWNLARAIYSIYTAKAVSYNRIYGSLSAVPILLLWIYIAWAIVLSGAVLTATLQRRIHPPHHQVV